MRWKDFEAKYPKELYLRVRQLCEEKHNEDVRKGGFSPYFCDYCYKREGWHCFPCSDTEKRYEERYGEPLSKFISKET